MSISLNKYIETTDKYARCIAASKRIRWDIDKDVIRGRHFNFSERFLPDGLSKVNELEFLSKEESRFLSQIQGRSYANIFGLVERFINAKILEISRDHWLGDQVALEALIRFSDEELKHQELFRRLETMISSGMPEGYHFAPQPDDVATVVLTKSTWSVLALTCHIELFTQAHYKESIQPNECLSPLYKDVFFYHWKEESQHAILDELEWRREDQKISEADRDNSVDDLIALVAAVDGIVVMQSSADADYFFANTDRNFSSEEQTAIKQKIKEAYRWQYIFSGVQEPRFIKVLTELTTYNQMEKITKALGSLQ